MEADLRIDIYPRDCRGRGAGRERQRCRWLWKHGIAQAFGLEKRRSNKIYNGRLGSGRMD